MTETQIDYYYAGKRFASKSMCMHLIPVVEGTGQVLNLSTASTYPLGCHMIITVIDGNRFRHIMGDKDAAPDELLNQWRLATYAAEEMSREARGIAKMKKDKMSIDNMTIAEIKTYCLKGSVNRYAIKMYLEKYFWG